jgi:hypothetical protein
LTGDLCVLMESLSEARLAAPHLSDAYLDRSWSRPGDCNPAGPTVGDWNDTMFDSFLWGEMREAARRLLAEVLAAIEEAERGPWVECSQTDVALFLGYESPNRPGLMDKLKGKGRIEGERIARYTWRFRFTDPDEHRRFLGRE